MKISGRGIRVSIQLDHEGSEVLRSANIQPEEALAANIIDEDERGLRIRIERGGANYWLLLRWSVIRSVEIPVPLPKQTGIR